MNLTTLTSTDGGRYSDHGSAFAFATALIEAAGFVLVGGSVQSSSLYFSRPGRDEQLRLADHPMYTDRGTVAQARLTKERVEIDHTWTDEIEGVIVEHDYENVIREGDADIRAIVAEAIGEYDAAMEAIDAEEIDE